MKCSYRKKKTGCFNFIAFVIFSLRHYACQYYRHKNLVISQYKSPYGLKYFFHCFRLKLFIFF